MVFADINTFFSPKGGGIKTYHLAKTAWFEKQDKHSYYLFYPAKYNHIKHLSPQVTYVGVCGIRTGKDEDGYRVFKDFSYMRNLLRDIKPDVIEAGDPWLTAKFAHNLRDKIDYQGILSSFCHSDPIRTWANPWKEKAPYPMWYKNRVSGFVQNWFLRHQTAFDYLLVSSTDVASFLEGQGFNNLVYTPFGVDASLFELALKPVEKQVKVLYMGRLGDEKGVDILLKVLPQLLQDENIAVTVVGRGYYEDFFKNFQHPNYQYHSFITEREKVYAQYQQHDIVVAPGPFETFGLGVLEALAAGKVVVAPRAGGAGEMLVQMMPNFSFEPHDSTDFLTQIRQAAQGNFAENSQKSRALAYKYGTWDDAVGRMVSFYEGALRTNHK